MPSDTPAARMRERAAKIAKDGCFVPPDGGSPTDAEADMCDRIADAIRALPLEDEWLPIETAPRDGSEIWAFNGEQARMKWAVFSEWSGWLYADDLMTDVDPDPPQPTHWRPLPAPPKGGE